MEALKGLRGVPSSVEAEAGAWVGQGSLMAGEDRWGLRVRAEAVEDMEPAVKHLSLKAGTTR